jgi:hypothetical protein
MQSLVRLTKVFSTFVLRERSMHKAIFSFTAIVIFGIAGVADDKPKAKKPLEALQPFNEFIGPWRGDGQLENADSAKQRDWRESVSWSWKFKGDDAWITVAFGKGRYLKNGEIHYLPDKDKYELTLETKDGKRLVFSGALVKEGRSFVAERVDEDKKETQRITFDLVGDIRFTYRFEHKPESRTTFIRDYRVGATREGESLASSKDNRPKCVVSGGLGTIAVSYKGTTYYVCCTGCRDAFNENPEKYIKEFEANKNR